MMFYNTYIAGFLATDIPRHLIVLAYSGLLAAAAIIDYRRFIIPNTLVVALLGLWPVWVAIAGTAPIHHAAIGALLVFVLGIALYSRGFMGGGDVKLISVLALWAGPAGLFPLILYISVAGGVLSVFWMTPMRPALAPVVGWAGGRRENKHIPYGVAIAAGGLLIAKRLWVG